MFTLKSAAPAHTHDFTYAADGATITATCNGAGTCDITSGTTLTISAPTGDLTADGSKTFTATLSTGYNTTAFPGTYTIAYTKDGQPFDGTPTEAGNYTASVTVGTATASVSYTVAAPELFWKHSVTLGGDIGVNFYLNPAVIDTYTGAKTVTFSWDGNETTVDVPATATADGYKVTCNVVAAEMAHKITAEVYSGETLIGEEQYSVQDYAEAVYADPASVDPEKPDELKALAKALLNYGAMAQTVFDSSLKEHPALANKTVGNNGYADVTAEQIGAAINGEASDLNEVATQLGAKYYTNSLIYLSKNTLRIYFTPTSYPGTIPNADKYAGNLSEYYYYVDHANIPAAELDDQQTFTVGGTTFTFSALDYAKAVVNSGMGDDQKNLAKSLYLYNQKANDYFAPKPPTAADALKNDSTVQVKVRVTSNGDWWRTKTWQYNNGTFNQTADVKGTSNALNCSLSASGDIITLRINYNNYSRTVTINTATNTYTETTSGNATWVSRLVWDNFIVNGIDMKPTLTKG
ncbi:hypothetical protein [uncultured Ruminococcus sp.]|uniref:hypothetical protein n=1 Tax=uncultured Ruminococcus sp. TaxID=165186 RepID=UPI002931B42D|nr:hypothetical protein [uncultured Ruminococcus sp.]